VTIKEVVEDPDSEKEAELTAKNKVCGSLPHCMVQAPSVTYGLWQIQPVWNT
jgi:hypothetical protein